MLTERFLYHIDACHSLIVQLQEPQKVSTKAQAEDTEVDKLMLDLPSCKTSIDQSPRQYQSSKFVTGYAHPLPCTEWWCKNKPHAPKG